MKEQHPKLPHSLLIALYIIASLGIFFIDTFACAADKNTSSIQIDVISQVEPASAVGILMSQDRTLQKLNPVISKPRPGIITVTFPFDRTELAPDSLATALVVSNKGEVVFGEVKPILDDEFGQSIANIPFCSDEQAISPALAGQASLLEELYRIRVKRRDQAKTQVNNLLSGELLERLQKLERGFGLAREKELTAELSPFDLIDRLSRIRDALRNWESRKASPPTPEPQVKETESGASEQQ